MRGLPLSILEAGQRPSVDFSGFLASQMARALRDNPDVERVETKHEGGAWSIALTYRGEMYRIPVSLEFDLVAHEDPNPYREAAA